MSGQAIRGALLRQTSAARPGCTTPIPSTRRLLRRGDATGVATVAPVASFSTGCATTSRRPRAGSAQAAAAAVPAAWFSASGAASSAASSAAPAAGSSPFSPRQPPLLRSPCSASSWGPLLAPCSQGQARWLSSTAPRSGHAISFSPGSTPELDAALEKIRKHILLPSYLKYSQRRKIYSPKYAAQLKSAPIELQIDDEIHQFHHVNLMTEMPNARAAARDAVGRMTTPGDFENLPRLLEGLHGAGRHMRSADNARIARRAGERGCILTVIECARSVRRTGFRLETSEVVAEIMTHVQLKAVNSAWDEQQTRQALTWSELVVDLLQDPNHGRRPARTTAVQPEEGQTPEEAREAAAAASQPYASAASSLPAPAYPLERDPQILVARLHLAAVVADKFGDAEAAKKVATYAADLVKLWPAGKGLRALHPAALYSDRRGELYYLHEDNKFLGVAAPLLHGLDEAITVLGSNAESRNVVAELKDRRDAVAAEVHSALSSAPSRRGAAVYQKLYGGGAKAEESAKE